MIYIISYWLLPVISACMWLGMLLAMFCSWEVQGTPRYASMSPGQRIAYISDIGASGLKPLFITGAVITTVFLDLSLLSERWLRHRGRLAKNRTVTEKVLAGLSIVFAILGTLGLILLSIFDTLRHPRLHRLFLLFFIGGYVISAIFLCWEYQRLGIHFRQHRVLRISFWVKLAFIIVEIGLACGFGACLYKGRQNPGAILEWVIALIFTFWVLSFILDLYPATRTRKHKHGLQVVDGHQMEAAVSDDQAGYANGRATNGLAPAPYR